MAPAFGRGESLVVDGLPLDLVLVKNPSGFRLGLKSFPAAGYATMIAINDNYADGRDMSWLWDVEFDSLRDGGVDQLTGSRAYDMALRLQYDDVAIGAVDTDIAPALAAFIRGAKGKPKRDLLHLHGHARHPPRAVQNHHSGGGLMTPDPPKPRTSSPSGTNFRPRIPAPSKGTIRVLQLYPRDMNIYGDWGNALVLAAAAALARLHAGTARVQRRRRIPGRRGPDCGRRRTGQRAAGHPGRPARPRESTLKELAEDGTPMLRDLRAVPAVREVLQDPARARSFRASASWMWKPTAPTNA